jgi:hypothetical protein
MTGSGEWSVLLWLMAAVVALLSSHLFIAWVRRAQAYVKLRDALGPLLLAAAAMALGINGSMVLALGAEGLTFPLGYRWVALPPLLLGAAVACLLPAWWLSRRQNLLALIGCGLLLAAVAVGAQVGWLLAPGFRPGLRWNPALASSAGLVAVVGFAAALWLAYSDASSHGARRTLWRLGAATLMVLAIVAGQEVMISAAGLPLQVGAIYHRELPSTWLALAAGAVVPTVLALLVLDVVLRNQTDRHRSHRSPTGVDLELPKRRKRRRKYRTL